MNPPKIGLCNSVQWVCGMSASMQKVIAYQDRAGEWRRRASEATKAQEKGGGRKDGCGLGVACQNARKAA